MTKKDFFSKIKCFIDKPEIDSVYDLKIAEGRKFLTINNTDDLWLNELQFEAITSLLSASSALYIAQIDSEEVYSLDLPTVYKAYARLNLFSLTFLSSKEFDWVIVIDEGLECGKAVLIGSEAFITAFCSRYRAFCTEKNNVLNTDGLLRQNIISFEVYFPTPLSEINNPFNDNIDVCVRTQDRKQYTLVFITPDNLKTLMESEGETYIHPDFKFIVVKSIGEEHIFKAISEITMDSDLLQQLGGD